MLLKTSVAAILFTGLFSCAHELYSERNTMNTTTIKQGSYPAQDALGNPITLQWQRMHGKTAQLNTAISALAPIFIANYVRTELEFARTMPEAVATDFMLKPLAPLLEQGAEKADWQLFEQKTQEILQQFFAATNWEHYSGADDVNIFVTAVDEHNNPLGAVQFIITPDFKSGTVKAGLSGITSAGENRGIEKLLMSSIFKLMPATQRIFLHTRATNAQDIQDYMDWGFVPFAGPLQHWTDFEYLATIVDVLQKVAQTIKG